MPFRESRSQREPVRQPSRTVLILCGARRTEPDYFEGLKKLLRRNGITVKVRGYGTDPLRLVKTAADYRARKPGVFDEVWCVFDVDAFDMEAAVRAAKAKDINVAISHPCFELWLLLHHTDCQAHCEDYEAVLLRLKRHVPLYDKARLDFALFAGGVHDAVRRAEMLDPSGQDHTRNPSTGVWVLAKHLLEQKP